MAQPLDGGALLGRGVGEGVGPPGQGADRAVEGLDDDGAGGRRRPRPASRARCGSRRRGRRAAARRRRPGPRGRRTAASRCRPRLASIRARWVATVCTASSGVRSSTIATAVVRSAACLQEVPGHLVGVAGRGGDEEPEVAGGEELGGELRGCAPRRSRRRGRRGSPDRRARPRSATSCRACGSLVECVDPLEVGQQPVLRRTSDASSGWCTSTGERVVGRSTTGLGDPVPDQGVDQRRLAGAGRAADHGQQRRLQRGHARDHVVLELVDHLAAGLRGARPSRAGRAAARSCCRASCRRTRAVNMTSVGRLTARPTASRGVGGRRVEDRGVAHRVGTTWPGKAIVGRTALIRAT